MAEPYDAPYLDEAEHAALDHSGIPGVGGGAAGDLDVNGEEGEPWFRLAVGDSLYFGDGATDVENGPAIYRTGSRLYVGAAAGSPSGTPALEVNNGVILNAPDGTKYAIRVANDGTLSTEVVT